MTDIEVYQVVAMPPAEAPAAVISRVSAVVAQPDYQIRLQLAGKMPKIIGHFRDKSAADAAVHSLKELGLAAFVVTESDLRRPPSRGFIARSLKIEGNRAVFTSREGGNETLNIADVFLILTGRRTRSVGEAGVETSKMKVNLPATLLSGGVPIMKRVTTRTTEPRKVTEQFIRLYLKGSDVPAVEICQFDFDYSFLGDKMGPTATGNIGATVAVLRQVFDRAYFNDTLINGFTIEAKSISGVDLGEQNCLLLVRYYRALATRPN